MIKCIENYHHGGVEVEDKGRGGYKCLCTSTRFD